MKKDGSSPRSRRQDNPESWPSMTIIAFIGTNPTDER
jgi:hypothetical protein